MMEQLIHCTVPSAIGSIFSGFFINCLTSLEVTEITAKYNKRGNIGCVVRGNRAITVDRL